MGSVYLHAARRGRARALAPAGRWAAAQPRPHAELDRWMGGHRLPCRAMACGRADNRYVHVNHNSRHHRKVFAVHRACSVEVKCMSTIIADIIERYLLYIVRAV
jgi:hypothetical protein